MNDELLQPPKGFRDYLPEEEMMRKKMLMVIENEFKNYGFVPMQTSAVESFEVLTSKFTNSEETDVFKEIYFFEDKGGRKLGLRYDLTIPLGRIIASNPKMPLPFKRYEIGMVWRDGPVKVGRLREFTQCDADIVGLEGGIAEAELLSLATSVLNKLGIKFKIEIGNRKILESLLDFCEIKNKKTTMISIDKLKKIGLEGVEKELKERGVEKEKIEKIKSFLTLKGVEALEKLRKTLVDENGKKGLKEIEEVFEQRENLGIQNLEFNPSLARGLDYYTGNVFEIFFADNPVTSSIAAGGRYENLVENFGGRKITATGMTFGLEVLLEEVKKSKGAIFIQALVIPIKTLSESLRITQELRQNGISAIIDYNGKSVGKNLEYASKQQIPFVVIVGDQELKQNKILLRNMETGEQKTITLDQAIETLKNTTKK